MKKIKLATLCILILGLCVMLSACKTNEAKAVENMISSLGSITEDSLPDIVSAMSAFEQLSPEEQKTVSNYAALEKAQNDYDLICAERVDALILAIGTIDDDSRPKIIAAREAYEKLTKSQKEVVSNYGALIAAEKEYPEYLIKRTTEAIRALDTADPNDLEKYDLAEKLYGLLSEEEKRQVNRALSNEPDPIQTAMVNRTSKLIERITYVKGNPTTEELHQMQTAAYAFLALPDHIRPQVENIETLKKELKEFEKFNDNREKTDKLYARAEYIKRCAEVEYEDLMTYPKSYKGKQVSLEILVDSIESTLITKEINAHTSNGEEPVILKDSREVKEPAFTEGDNLIVYGVFDGTRTIKITEEGSGWFGTSVFGKVLEEHDVPVILISYASNDNPGVIANGDPSAKDLTLDEEREALIQWLLENALQIVTE